MRSKDQRKGSLGIKLDVSKAYDRVEWAFLEGALGKLGFHERFIWRVMDLDRSVSTGVLINGQPSDFFQPSRGLRQGDPISPYLFLVISEGLSGLI